AQEDEPAEQHEEDDPARERRRGYPGSHRRRAALLVAMAPRAASVLLDVVLADDVTPAGHFLVEEAAQLLLRRGDDVHPELLRERLAHVRKLQDLHHLGMELVHDRLRR